MDTPSVEEFLAQRPRLFRLAYRMLGEAGEAEDVVQDEYLRWAGAVRAEIAYPSAWLTKVVTNLCLSRLTSARARRENYVGPWLPEPVLTADGALGPLETVEQRDSVSLALLRLMEQLTPTERAVFVLREALPTTIGRSPSFSTSRRPTPGSFMTGPGSASGRGPPGARPGDRHHRLRAVPRRAAGRGHGALRRRHPRHRRLLRRCANSSCNATPENYSKHIPVAPHGARRRMARHRAGM